MVCKTTMDSMILLPDSQESDCGENLGDEENVWKSEAHREGRKEVFSSFARVMDDIDLFTVHQEDYVYLYSFIGKVLKLWQNSKGNKIARVQLYFYPRQTKQQEKPYHGKTEILPSNINVRVPLSSIQGTCNVESLAEYFSRNEYPDNLFYISGKETCQLSNPKMILTANDLLDLSADLINVVPASKPIPEQEIKVKQNNSQTPQTKSSTTLNESSPVPVPSLPPLSSQEEFLMDEPLEIQENQEFETIYEKLENMTAAQLRAECDQLGLPSGGGKSNLISRLFATKKAASLSKQVKKESNSSPQAKLYPSVHFGPKKEVSTPSPKRLQRVKVDEVPVISLDDVTDLTCIEKLEQGFPIHKIGFSASRDAKLKISSSVRIIGDVDNSRYHKTLQSVSQRTSPLKPKPKTSRFSARNVAKQLKLDILADVCMKDRDSKAKKKIQMKSPPKESTFGNEVDLLSVQQRERRTASSANLTEEIILSSGDETSPTPKAKRKLEIQTSPVKQDKTESSDSEDDLMNDEFLDEPPKKKFTRLRKQADEEEQPRKALSRGATQTKPISSISYPKLSSLDSSSSSDESDGFLSLEVSSKKRSATRGEISLLSPEHTSDLDDFIVDDESEPPKKKHKGNDEDSEDVIMYPDENTTFQQHFSTKQAFSVYLQYLASCLLDKNFIEQLEGDRESFCYFEPARKKIEHALVDRRDLIVTSSVWGPDFQDDMKRFSKYSSNHAMSTMDCEACRRSNHPATYMVNLSGRAYDSEILWKTKSIDIEEQDEGTSKSYFLGRHCHTRTWLYHRLHHSKYRMIKAVSHKIEFIKKNVTTKPVEIVQAILDDAQFVSDQYSRLQNLLQEADEFAKLGSSERHPTL